jgi:hypothetical protein
MQTLHAGALQLTLIETVTVARALEWRQATQATRSVLLLRRSHCPGLAGCARKAGTAPRLQSSTAPVLMMFVISQ